MSTPKIPESEYRFCLIMWEKEPVAATDMVKLCQEQLGWKRTTTYWELRQRKPLRRTCEDTQSPLAGQACPLHRRNFIPSSKTPSSD